MNTPEHLRTLLVRTVTGAQSQKATQGIPDDIYAIGDSLDKFDWGKFPVGKYDLFSLVVRTVVRLGVLSTKFPLGRWGRVYQLNPPIGGVE